MFQSEVLNYLCEIFKWYFEKPILWPPPPNEMIWRDGIQDTGLHVLCLLSAFNEAGEESAAFPPQSHSAGSKRAVACVP